MNCHVLNKILISSSYPSRSLHEIWTLKSCSLYEQIFLYQKEICVFYIYVDFQVVNYYRVNTNDCKMTQCGLTYLVLP